jgi:hypothetical protein
LPKKKKKKKKKKKVELPNSADAAKSRGAKAAQKNQKKAAHKKTRPAFLTSVSKSSRIPDLESSTGKSGGRRRWEIDHRKTDIFRKSVDCSKKYKDRLEPVGVEATLAAIAAQQHEAERSELDGLVQYNTFHASTEPSVEDYSSPGGLRLPWRTFRMISSSPSSV